MRLIALADIHGSTRFAGPIGPVLDQADLLVLAGDLTDFGGRRDAERVLAAFESVAVPIRAVPGNCDRSGVDEVLSVRSLNLDDRVEEAGMLQVAGLGGSLPCPGQTVYECTEEQMEARLHRLGASLSPHLPTVLVSHQPPYDTRVDLASNGLHVGSVSVRRFIEHHQPLLCITGHIHEGRGVDRIGRTIVVNPGPFRDGSYAVCECGEDGATVEINRVPGS